MIILLFFQTTSDLKCWQRKNDKAISTIHKYRISVQVVWLIPNFNPMFITTAGRPKDYYGYNKNHHQWLSHY